MLSEMESVLGNQSLSGFLEARSEASEILRAEEVKAREVSFEEALVLQVTANILSEREHIYGYEISETTPIKSGSIYPILRRFEAQYGLFTSEAIAQDTDRQLRHRKVYTPTPLGEQLLELFIPPGSK